MLNILYKILPYDIDSNNVTKIKKYYDNNTQFLQYSNPLCFACQPRYRPVWNAEAKAID